MIVAPLLAIQVIQERRKNDVIFTIPCYIPVNHESRPNDVIAMDPGIRTFMTTCDTNGSGFCTRWGCRGYETSFFVVFAFG